MWQALVLNKISPGVVSVLFSVLVTVSYSCHCGGCIGGRVVSNSAEESGGLVFGVSESQQVCLSVKVVF